MKVIYSCLSAILANLSQKSLRSGHRRSAMLRTMLRQAKLTCFDPNQRLTVHFLEESQPFRDTERARATHPEKTGRLMFISLKPVDLLLVVSHALVI